MDQCVTFGCGIADADRRTDDSMESLSFASESAFSLYSICSRFLKTLRVNVPSKLANIRASENFSMPVPFCELFGERFNSIRWVLATLSGGEK